MLVILKTLLQLICFMIFPKLGSKMLRCMTIQRFVTLLKVIESLSDLKIFIAIITSFRLLDYSLRWVDIMCVREVSEICIVA